MVSASIVRAPINISEITKDGFQARRPWLFRVVRRSVSPNYHILITSNTESDRFEESYRCSMLRDSSFSRCETLNAHRSSLFNGVCRIHQLCSNVLAHSCTHTSHRVESISLHYRSIAAIHVDPALNYDRTRVVSSNLPFAIRDVRRTRKRVSTFVKRFISACSDRKDGDPIEDDQRRIFGV